MADRRLKMSLDDIISSNDKKSSPRGNSKPLQRQQQPTAGKRGGSTRDQRKTTLHAAPNTSSRNGGGGGSSSSSGNRPMSKLAQLHKASNSDVSMKFLLKNAECGKLIGTGGVTKDELMEITGATIQISSYTGTGEARCVYISGKDSEVSLCCCMLWELIGYCTANIDSSSGWKPSVARKTPGAFDDEEVEGEICIPAHLAGGENITKRHK